jgi:predicted Zn finger-like uncharacterized protein
MIITCPACQAQYILPDDAIGPKGRRVKCTSCAYTWLQAPENELAADEVDFGNYLEVGAPSPRTVPVPRPSMTPVMSENIGKSIVVGAGGGIALFVVTLGMLVMMRQGLVPQWPPLAMLFDRIGMSVPAPGIGLAIHDLVTTLTPENNPDKLQVTGKLVNTTKINHSLPSLLIRASGAKGWLKDWHIDLYGKALMAEQSVNFDYVLKDIPAGITDITVRFTEK